MKIGKFPVKHSYKPARIISDVLSLAIAFVIVNSTLIFFAHYKQESKVDVDTIYALIKKYGKWWLLNRHKFAWMFPGLVAGIFITYLILVLKNHKFAKFSVTKQNAQAAYDWYAFAVSLCKIPLLLCVFNVMYIYQQRMFFNDVNVFSPSILLYVLVIVIIIRLSVHRIKALTKPAAKKEESGGVKARIVEEEPENSEK